MASKQDDSKGDVKQRAVDNIMKLINSQLALEKKQAKMNPDVRPAARLDAQQTAVHCHLCRGLCHDACYLLQAVVFAACNSILGLAFVVWSCLC